MNLRLCRLPCGKALPYRISNSIEYEATPSVRGIASSFHVAGSGKAKPYRTAGGVAENRYKSGLKHLQQKRSFGENVRDGHSEVNVASGRIVH